MLDVLVDKTHRKHEKWAGILSWTLRVATESPVCEIAQPMRLGPINQTVLVGVRQLSCLHVLGEVTIRPGPSGIILYSMPSFWSVPPADACGRRVSGNVVKVGVLFYTKISNCATSISFLVLDLVVVGAAPSSLDMPRIFLSYAFLLCFLLTPTWNTRLK